MIIPVSLSPPAHRPAPLQPTLARLGSDEMVLIELQGWLDVVEGEKTDGFIGNLTMQNDKPVLVIGHHLLEGKLITLPKPLAVLERRTGTDTGTIGSGTETTHYNIVTIIKRKVTFSKRPVPAVKRP